MKEFLNELLKLHIEEFFYFFEKSIVVFLEDSPYECLKKTSGRFSGEIKDFLRNIWNKKTVEISGGFSGGISARFLDEFHEKKLKKYLEEFDENFSKNCLVEFLKQFQDSLLEEFRKKFLEKLLKILWWNSWRNTGKVPESIPGKIP